MGRDKEYNSLMRNVFRWVMTEETQDTLLRMFDAIAAKTLCALRTVPLAKLRNSFPSKKPLNNFDF